MVTFITRKYASVGARKKYQVKSIDTHNTKKDPCPISSHIHVISFVEVAKMHTHMNYENHNAKNTQDETLSLLDRLLSVVNKTQIIRGILADPSYCFDKELLIINQFRGRVIQSIEKRKLLINEILDVNEVVLESFKVFPATQAERLNHMCEKLVSKKVHEKFNLACLRFRVENTINVHGGMLSEIFTQLKLYT